ncbi:recombinase family protein [Ferruginibacter lapsinanis]|uniref:recombinase family protein n=1 Tax=Ferruginibacter lapsinanis TaxID=563172 RepID=UPI001E42774A|nr:recombinase family protein [Ferruginibacter lapsinanis]UEG50308.1 recombinase family protein [Ferruginibacter lapsinanis]
MTLGVYCRISKLKDEGKDRSISNQKKLGIEKAKRLKIEYDLYVDEGYSGASENIEDRPELNRLLTDIVNGKVTAVFAYDQSRFERNPQMRYAIGKIFKDCEVEYYTHVDGKVDLNDPQAELFGDMLSVFNKYHVTLTKLKVKSVLKQRAEEGKAHGIMAYGYKRDVKGKISIDADEAKIVKRIYSLSLKGIGTRSIAALLNSEEVPTRYNIIGKGKLSTKNKYTKEITTKAKKDILWSGNTIRNIITNKCYAGERTYSNEVYQIPAIIKIDYWQKVNDNLSKNANNSGKKVVHRYLLKGLIRCGVCQRNMYGRTRIDKHDNYYMCSSKRMENENCENRSINIDKIENFIWGNLFTKKDFFKRLESEFKFNKSKLQELESDIISDKKLVEGLNSERQKAIDLRLKDLISDDDLRNIKKRLEGIIKDTNLKLADAEHRYQSMLEGEGLVKKLKHAFEDYTQVTNFKQKQNIINEYIKNIIVTFVDDRYYNIEIQYKGELGIETWKTPDRNANNFYTLKLKPDGTSHAIVSAPRPIKNPKDNSNWENFMKTSGDFKLVSNNRHKPNVYKPKLKKK